MRKERRVREDMGIAGPALQPVNEPVDHPGPKIDHFIERGDETVSERKEKHADWVGASLPLRGGAGHDQYGSRTRR